eukprot:sb/3470820/
MITCKLVLQYLAVTKCELEGVDGIKGLERFANLRHLNLDHNRITSLNELTLAKLSRLEEIRLGNNNLDKFPLILTELPKLKSISLVYNLISDIPEQVVVMRNLEALHLDHNYLSEMPEYVTQQLPSLRSLTFSHNQLNWEEESIRECFHLGLVDFSNNGVRPRSAFDNFGVTGRATLVRKKKPGSQNSLLRLALSA